MTSGASLISVSWGLNMSDCPEPLGFFRLPQVLAIIPISRSQWWEGVRQGRYPSSLKLGPRTTAWRTEDIRELCALLADGKDWRDRTRVAA